MADLYRRRMVVPVILIVGGTLAAILIRLPFLESLSHDIIGFLGQWYDYIVLNGGVHALGDRFANYTPTYLYLLTASAYAREYALPILSKIVAIKLPSLAADFVLAVGVYKLARVLFRDSLKPAVAYVVVLLLPTVVINSALWGQADAIYSACVVWCVYLLCARRPAPAMIAFGLGLAFKAQAVFIAPLVLFLLLRRVLRIRDALIAPAVYVLVMLPAIALGRPPLDALGTYMTQAGEFRALSEGAPNLYLFAPPDLYHLGLTAGLAVSVIAGLALAVAFTLRAPNPSADDTLACALACAALMPFVLPKMHERYFYVAEVLSVVAALRWYGLAWLPVAYQAISLSAYATVLQALSGWYRVLPDVKAFVWLNVVAVASVLAGTIAFRATDRPALRRKAVLALAVGGAAILAVVGVAAALAPSNRRAPVWMGSADTFRPAQAISITYGDAIDLVGFDLPQPRTYRTGVMRIDLFFKPIRPLDLNYRLRLEAFATDGQSLRLLKEDPVDEGSLDAWLPGGVYLQRRFLTVWPSVDAPVLAQFRVSWIDPNTGNVLPARCGDSPCDGRVGLIPIGLDYVAVSDGLRARAMASFGPDSELKLVGLAHERTSSPGQAVTITSTWRLEAASIPDWTLFVHLLSADGNLVAQADAQPHGGLYPTRVWHWGEVVVDALRVALPADLAAGDYRIVLGTYRSDTIERQLVRSADGAGLPDNVFPVGTLQVRAGDSTSDGASSSTARRLGVP